MDSLPPCVALVRAAPLTLALCVLPSVSPTDATAAVVVTDPALHQAALDAAPGAGAPRVEDFELLPFGALLTVQLAGWGLEFSSSAPFVVLPEAFGAAARGSRCAAVGYAPGQGSELTVVFAEPQRAFAAWFIDAGEPMEVTVWRAGAAEEIVTLSAPGENVPGGVFRALWFEGQADAITFLGGANEDGFGIDDVSAATVGTVDNDGDGAAESDGDCDDADAGIGPTAPDGCDGVDSDCDGLIDDDADADGDGVAGCAGDCDDADPSVRPGAAESCDGRDEDCDGLIDELPDGDGDGALPCAGDCDDGRADVYGGASETCDGVDNDCDGLIDESPDLDGDGFTVCEGDCDDDDGDVFPGQGCDDAEAGGDDDAADDDDDAANDDPANDDDADDDDAADHDDAADDDAAAARGIAGGGCGCTVERRHPPALAWVLLAFALPRRRRGPRPHVVQRPCVRPPPLLLALVASLFAAPLRAQDLPESSLGLDTMRFRPAVTPTGGAMTDGADPGAGWRFDVALAVSFARREVVFTDGSALAEPVISSRLSGLLRAGVTLGGVARITLDLPVALAQDGVHPASGESLPVGGVGDLAITPHVMVLHPSRSWIGVALASPITFPTGRVDALLGEPGPTINPRVVLEKRLRFPRAPLLNFSITAQAGWHVRPRTTLLDLDSAGALTLGAGVRWDPIDRVALAAEVVGAVGRGANARHAEWLSSLRVVPDRDRRFSVSAGAGVGLTRAVGTPEARLFLVVAAGMPWERRAALGQDDALPAPLAATAAGPEPPYPGARAGAAWGLRLVGRQASIDARLLFAHDAATLRPDARDLLTEVAGWALAHDGVLLVTGHADPTGADAYNDRLSAARAEAVVAFLTRAGVPPERLRAAAVGERQPLPRVAASSDAAAWADSRRVEFHLLPPHPSEAPLRASPSFTRPPLGR